MEQWLDDYWYANVQPTASTLNIDKVVQKMFNMLLIMGDGEMQQLRDQNVISPITGKNLNEY